MNITSRIEIALEINQTLENRALSVHPHHTLTEMIMLAIEAVIGKTIKQKNSLLYINRKK